MKVYKTARRQRDLWTVRELQLQLIYSRNPVSEYPKSLPHTVSIHLLDVACRAPLTLYISQVSLSSVTVSLSYLINY